jgi:hypothetical protein
LGLENELLAQHSLKKLLTFKNTKNSLNWNAVKLTNGYFQQDSAAPHTTINHLKEFFPEPIDEQSPDLTPLDFFLW